MRSRIMLNNDDNILIVWFIGHYDYGHFLGLSAKGNSSGQVVKVISCLITASLGWVVMPNTEVMASVRTNALRWKFYEDCQGQ